MGEGPFTALHKVKHVLRISQTTDGGHLILREVQYVYFRFIKQIPLHEVGYQQSLHTFVSVCDCWLQKCKLQHKTYKMFIQSFSKNICSKLSRGQGADTLFIVFKQFYYNRYYRIHIEYVYRIQKIMEDFYSSVRNVMQYLTVLITQISKQVGVWRHWWSSVFPICSKARYCFNSVLIWQIVLNEHKILHKTLYYSKSIKSFLNLFQNSFIFLILFAPYHSGHLEASSYRNK